MVGRWKSPKRCGTRGNEELAGDEEGHRPSHLISSHLLPLIHESRGDVTTFHPPFSRAGRDYWNPSQFLNGQRQGTPWMSRQLMAEPLLMAESTTQGATCTSGAIFGFSILLKYTSTWEYHQVNKNTNIEQVPKNIINQSLEDGGGIGEIEWHNYILYSKVLKAFFHSSPSLILTKWEVLRRSSLEKVVAPCSSSKAEEISGRGDIGCLWYWVPCSQCKVAGICHSFPLSLLQREMMMAKWFLQPTSH